MRHFWMVAVLLLPVTTVWAKDKPIPPLSPAFANSGLRALIVIMNEDNQDSPRIRNAMDEAEAQQNNPGDEKMFSDLLIFAGIRRLQRATRECKDELETAFRQRKAIDLPKSCHY
jgi:hypothetical protein